MEVVSRKLLLLFIDKLMHQKDYLFFELCKSASVYDGANFVQSRSFWFISFISMHIF